VEITAIQPGDRQVLQGYGKGGFQISDHHWPGAVLVFRDRVVAWTAADLAGITLESLGPVRTAEPPVEILLIGTGARMALLPAALRADLKALGFAVEMMDTGAACRTYNLLLSEERRVAAALLPVG